MVDRLTKNLAKLNNQELKTSIALIQQILTGDLSALDIVKLTGSKDIYRARKGKLRIIFRKSGSEYTIIALERRSAQTYKHLT